MVASAAVFSPKRGRVIVSSNPTIATKINPSLAGFAQYSRNIPAYNVDAEDGRQKMP